MVNSYFSLFLGAQISIFLFFWPFLLLDALLVDNNVNKRDDDILDSFTIEANKPTEFESKFHEIFGPFSKQNQ